MSLTVWANSLLVMYAVNSNYGRTIGRGNSPFWCEYIAMYGQQSPASVKQCAWIWERPKAVPAASEVNGASRTANPRVDCETTSNTAAVSPRVVQKRRDAFASLLATGEAHHANPPTGVTNKLAIGKTKCQSFVMCVRNYGVPNSVVGQKDSSQTQAVQSVLLTKEGGGIWETHNTYRRCHGTSLGSSSAHTTTAPLALPNATSRASAGAVFTSTAIRVTGTPSGGQIWRRKDRGGRGAAVSLAVSLRPRTEETLGPEFATETCQTRTLPSDAPITIRDEWSTQARLVTHAFATRVAPRRCAVMPTRAQPAPAVATARHTTTWPDFAPTATREESLTINK